MSMPTYRIHFAEFSPGVDPTEYALEKYRALYASYTGPNSTSDRVWKDGHVPPHDLQQHYVA
jgi:hypothetical protein